MDGRPGPRLLGTDNNRSFMLSPEFSSQWPARRIMEHEATYLPRSKSDLDMSRLPRMPSSSQLSYNPPSSTRSEIFPQSKDEKQTGVKQLISKSSRLLQKRRSTNKLRSMDLTSSTDSFGLDIDTGRRRTRSGKLSSPYLEAHHRPYISDPYNFQHLTHTGPAQAKILQDASANQMITEFSAIRASQAAQSELKGIKAMDIISPNDSDSYSPISSRAPSPPQSPNSISESSHLRSVKSVDSFTRLNRTTSNSFSSPHPPISPPPRRSSRQAVRLSQPQVLNTIDGQTTPDVSSPTYPPKQYFHHKVASVDESLAPTQEIAQAVTTPDDSALLLITHQRNPSSAGLADVPEEEEEAAKHDRKSKDLRQTKSFPARASFQCPTPHFGDDDVPTRFSRRISTNWAQANWEADIDYCYEHAMDANWDDEDFWAEETTPEAKPEHLTSPYGPNFSLPSGLTSTDSATSSSISVPGIITPCDTAPLRDSADTANSLLWPHSPASGEFVRDIQEEQYRFLQSEYAKEPVSYPATIATENSPRSSGTGITKWSSRESLSTKAISATSDHRHSHSGSSNPDMLPFGMSKRSINLEVEAASFHRTTSSESITATIPILPPPPPPPITRSRTDPDFAGKLLDLDLIGAPAPIHRTRSGSIASAKSRQSASQARVGYNLFPNPNGAILSR